MFETKVVCNVMKIPKQFLNFLCNKNYKSYDFFKFQDSRHFVNFQSMFMKINWCLEIAANYFCAKFGVNRCSSSREKPRTDRASERTSERVTDIFQKSLFWGPYGPKRKDPSKTRNRNFTLSQNFPSLIVIAYTLHV